jgi:L-lactate dehydrogenase complex protein LldG
MSDARDEILARIREALRQPSPRPHLRSENAKGKPSALGRPWLPDPGSTLESRLALLTDNLAKLRAQLIRCPDLASARAALAALAAERGWKEVATHAHPDTRELAAGLPCASWEVDGGLDRQRLEAVDAGLTTCQSVIAQTGAILVASTSEGGRTLSILPHVHVVVARVGQVVGDLADALEQALGRHGGELPSMLSFITGPSRTGDIERILVLGAHGPRELIVLLVG